MKVELRDIHKTFGAVHANDGITLTIPAGTIYGVLGENGAGKSTLMKILSGFIQADHGEILLNDRPVVIHSPADAIRQGIGMLHQDPLDFPPMQVLDDFLIGSHEGVFPIRYKVRRELLELNSRFGFSIEPEAYIDSLTVGERQQLEILRLLWLGAGILILDEPTTGISAPQKEKLFATLRKLADAGKTVIFVTHKLDEIELICDVAAVLRQGKLVGESRPPYNSQKLVKMMFNKEITLGGRESACGGDVAMRLENLSVEDYRMRLSDINLEVCNGEIIGLAGMEGSGQDLLLRACAGLVRPVGGKITIYDHDLTGKPYRAYLEEGIAFLPAARLEEGLVPGLTLTEHFLLVQDSNRMFINWEKAESNAGLHIREYNIRGKPESTVESLSGGNQQRTLLALLNRPLALILLEHPTRGLDIESTIYIWHKLKERCKVGVSILFISSDLEEILRYSNRVLVFFSGRVSSPLDADTTTVDQLGELIGGRGWPEADIAQGTIHG